MRFTRVSASVKTTSAFSLVWRYNACISHACLHLLRRLLRFSSLQCMRFTRVSETFVWPVHVFHTRLCINTAFAFSIKTTSALSLLCRYNACVSHTCLHLLRQLLHFSSYRVTMHAFLMRVWIGLVEYCVFLGMALQCMCFTRVSASVKTTSAFSLVWRYNARVSHACLYCFKRLLRFPWYGVKVHVFHTCLCIYLYGFRVFLGMALQCMRFIPLKYVLKRLLRFLWYCITMHAFQMRVFIS